ncbi:flagellar protein FliT [Gorillibacterium sp. sgz500922]|uniref:flagellar protein FliT n=1 Tax=Gorillibacterium sp. sgz500922 TaxID=3446694 RepID=UPI003F679147
MDELLDRLLFLTEDVLGRLEELTSDELAEWVKAREALIEQIRRQPSKEFRGEERRRKVDRLLGQSPAIVARMEELRAEAAGHLNKRGQARLQKSAYDAVVAPDSFYIDKKK